MYTVVINGKPQGPFDLTQLKNLGIGPDTFVRTPQMDDYKEAHEIAELRTLFGFREQQIMPQYFASFDQRLMASAIDFFFITIIYVLLMMITHVIVSQLTFFMIGVLLAILVPFVKMIYGSFAESSVKQGTIGKRLMDIKVTDSEGRRLSYSTALARNLAKICSVLPLFFGYIYCFLNKKQQCFHDLIAGTLVTKQRLI